MDRKLIVLFLLSTVLVSCKIDKKDDPSASQPAGNDTKETSGAGYKIAFNAVVEKDDVFHLFYNEDGSENFDGEQMVELQLKGSSQPQDIVFVLPDDALPLNLRFDIGSNADLKQVKFNQFKIDYKDKNVTADRSNFFKYFYPNDQVVCDTINAVAKIVQQPQRPYDPIIGGTGLLQSELERLQMN